jgi:hypothetical protein
MRSLLFWTLGTAVAFALTAGAFLSLASLAEDPSDVSIQGRTQQPNRNPLQLDFDKAQLEKLGEQEEKTSLKLTVRNSGDRTFSKVNVVLSSFSANTSNPEQRYYRATVEDLRAGGSGRVNLDLELSPTTQEKQWVLEARATTPRGISAVKTAVIER